MESLAKVVVRMEGRVLVICMSGMLFQMSYFRRTSARTTGDYGPPGATIQIPMLILTWS